MDTFGEPSDSHDEEEFGEEYQLFFGIVIETVTADVDGCFQNMSSTKCRLKQIRITALV